MPRPESRSCFVAVTSLNWKRRTKSFHEFEIKIHAFSKTLIENLISRISLNRGSLYWSSAVAAKIPIGPPSYRKRSTVAPLRLGQSMANLRTVYSAALLAGVLSFGMAGFLGCVSRRGLRWCRRSSMGVFDNFCWQLLWMGACCSTRWGVRMFGDYLQSQEIPHEGSLAAVLIGYRCLVSWWAVPWLQYFSFFTYSLSVTKQRPNGCDIG